MVEPTHSELPHLRRRAAAGPWRVLMVCMGNICRSPTAQGVLEHKLRAAGLAGQVQVDSAGTVDDRAGSPPDARSGRANCAAPISSASTWCW